MRRLVAIGSTKGHDYSAFLPIVGLYWRDRIGYQPEFFLVGNAEEWDQGHTAVVLDALEHHGLNYHFVNHIQGVEDATIAQCVRQHAAAYAFPEEDLLICSDADLVPLKKEFYYQHDPEKFEIGLYYANGYKDEVNHYPSCHMSQRVKTWREVMGYHQEPMEIAMARSFLTYGLADKMKAKQENPQKSWGHVWFADELIASQRIVDSGKSRQLINREGHPPVDRLDRACWPNQYDANQLTDCHSIRPIWSVPNWPRFRPIIEQTMPQLLGWADEFILKFRKAMGVDA